MKKIISIFFTFLLCVMTLTSCYQDFYYNSLDDYIEKIVRNKYRIGFSEYSIDNPHWFLPTSTFITDFEYIDGEYHFYEEDPIRLHHELPSTCLLVLQYEAEVYEQAKETMMSAISIYKGLILNYGNYNFYMNTKDAKEVPNFVNRYACYNDEKQLLCFISFYDNGGVIDEKYYEDLSGNWLEFIDTYYGKYYNFDE